MANHAVNRSGEVGRFSDGISLVAVRLRPTFGDYNMTVKSTFPPVHVWSITSGLWPIDIEEEA
ncbi:MAG: hypothetical protein KDB03_24070 [Planctomycetales bacterium]|nr:hypothetical protein [Planctomycetales bacterium]